jgi:hypothetical protein|tara:strand:+ start:663 stop:971 length:309 start_codon:yes stop_codon:yes gene_type:complete
MATLAFDVYGTLINTDAVVSQLREWINPLSPPSDPVQRRLQSPPAKSNFLAVPKNPPSKQIVQMSLGSGMTRRRFVLTGSMVVASAKSLVGENGDQFTEEIQ